MNSFIKSKYFFLWLTALVGLIYIFPFHNFQYYLSQGDHGRDLCCFQETMEGKLPYRDYSWLFGPLMPYYYAIFLKLFGISVQSVNWGYNILILLTGFVVYFICAEIISKPLAFCSAMWYWTLRDTEFFYTYNHIGALLMILLALLFLFKYLNNPRNLYLAGGYFSVFICSLIRLNMGLSTLLALLVSLLVINGVKKYPPRRNQVLKNFFLAGLVLAATFLVYWLFLKGLPSYIIQQSLPYGKEMRADTSNNILVAVSFLIRLVWSYFWATWQMKFVSLFIIIALLEIIWFCGNKRNSPEMKSRIFTVLIPLFIFIVCTLHEYLGSAVIYRHVWLIPLVIITVATIIHFTFITSPPQILTGKIKAFIFILLIGSALIFLGRYQILIKQAKNQSHLLKIGANRIYLLNDAPWIDTVTSASNYIKDHVAPDEKLLTLPMDTLYNFLAQRKQPVRQLAFLVTTRITPEQEQEIIRELEKQKVNWVLVSNRARSPEPAIGLLGETHLSGLLTYLNDNFKIDAQFGDWKAVPIWIGNHAVRILKRK